MSENPRVRLRPVTPADHDHVLELNELEVRMLAPMDAARLTTLHGWSHRFDVIELNDVFAGFVVTFASGTDYDSENYRWFTQRYDRFYYLDRIALAPAARRRGVGRRVYDQLELVAARYGRMTLEVNLVPPNPASLAFHGARGYAEVGQLGDVEHRVSLMTKELPS